MKKIFLIFIFVIFLSGTISALDFDNSKTHSFENTEDKYGTITINNMFGLGEKLAEYKLTYNTDQCLINCYAEGEVKIYSRQKLFSGKDFYNDKGKKVDLSYSKIFIWKEEIIRNEIPKYKEVCQSPNPATEKGNSTKCEMIEDGTIITEVNVGSWEEYNEEEYDAGNYKWRIEAKKNSNERIDWVVKALGKDFKEWAWWNMDWQGCKDITIRTTNPSVTNYTIPLTVSYESLMNSNFSDLRFVEGGCFDATNELGYWLFDDTYLDGVQANVSVKLPSFTSATNLTIAMYYGNTLAGSTSNINDAYMLGDNFNGSALNSGLWNTLGAGFTLSNGVISFLQTSGSGFGDILSKQNFSTQYQNYSVVVKAKYISNPDGRQSIGFSKSNGVAPFKIYSSDNISLISSVGPTPSYIFFTEAGAVNPFTLTAGSYQIYDMIYGKGGSKARMRDNAYNNLVHGNHVSIPFAMGCEDSVCNLNVSWVGVSSYYENINATFGGEQTINNIIITLNYPPDSFSTYETSINFNGTFNTEGTETIENITIRIWNSSNDIFYEDTILSIPNNTYYEKIWTVGSFYDDSYKWNYFAGGTSGNNYYASTNRTFTVDSTAPSVNITYPVNGTFYFDEYISNNSKIVNLNWTISDLNLQSCWIYNGTGNYSVNCGDNSTNINIEYNTDYNYIFYVNDSFGNINYSSTNFRWDYSILENQRIYDLNIYETDLISMSINVTGNSSLSSAALVWNGTSYPTTKTTYGNTTIFNRTINVQTISSIVNVSSYWVFSFSGSTLNSSTISQTINPIYFNLCNGSLTDDFLILKFEDENSLTTINGSISTSSFNYSLGGDYSKLYSYINNTENYNYTFCFTPANRTIYVTPRVQYKSTDYPQRVYKPSLLTLTNSSTTKILYLLSSADGLYVTFQVIDSSQKTLSGVEVSATRVISGETVTIATGTTDAAGSVTFWLNPDFEHTITFIKTGYENFIYVTTPTQSSYTIVMGTTTQEEEDYTKGITYVTFPSKEFLDNWKLYDFNFTITSNNLTLSEYGFSLYYSNGTLIGTQVGSVSSGGFLQVTNVNTTNQSSIYMDYYYIISSNTNEGRRTWIIQSTDGRSFSIFHFIEDLNLYISAGIFGIDEFGKLLISFVIIVLVTGSIGYRYGLRSEATVMGILFGIVLLLDYGLGFIPDLTIGGLGIPNFLTYMTFIILVAMIIREERL